MILIDGHNLIPKIRGLSLKMEEDEQALITLLSEYARITRNKLEVYFDKAPLNHAGTRKLGIIKAHFIRDGLTADEMIIQRVRNMGSKARNVRVISSDHHIIRNVKHFGAASITSEEFAIQLETVLNNPPPSSQDEKGVMSSDELAFWMDLFSNKKP